MMPQTLVQISYCFNVNLLAAFNQLLKSVASAAACLFIEICRPPLMSLATPVWAKAYSDTLRWHQLVRVDFK
jgi:hypothetical protein